MAGRKKRHASKRMSKTLLLGGVRKIPTDRLNNQSGDSQMHLNDSEMKIG